LLEVVNLENVTLITSSTEQLPVNLRLPLTQDLERETLLRVHGPYHGFLITWKILYHLSLESNIIYPWQQDVLKQHAFFGPAFTRRNLPGVEFLQTLLSHRRICLLADYPMYNYLDNIRMKFVEGCGIDMVQLIEPVELAHGTYQCLEGQRLQDNKTVFIWFTGMDNEVLTEKMGALLEKYQVWTITSDLPYTQKVLHYELIINEFILQLMDYLSTDQINWPGKKTQGILYNM
jgi:hypothetical protein